ncbi:MAG: hypothetical protein AB1585_11130 [Thermodesulfobacteriota bacterium]
MNHKAMLRDEKGLSLIALMVAILILGTIGFIISSLMSSHQETVPVVIDSTRAFYTAQGGVEYVGKYLKVSGGSDWTTAPVPPNQPISLGSGSFTVTFTPVDADHLTATVIGTSGSAQRQTTVNFEKTSGPAVRSQGSIALGNNAGIDCNPFSGPDCNNSNLGTCPCAAQSVTIPSLSPSGGSHAVCGSHGNNFSLTIPAGTYFCSSGISFGNNANITITGVVRLFTASLSMGTNALINSTGNAANLLLAVQGNVTAGSNLQFKGALFAPGYTIAIGNNALVTGTVSGGVSGGSGTVTFGNNSLINLDANAGGGVGGGSVTVHVADWQE